MKRYCELCEKRCPMEDLGCGDGRRAYAAEALLDELDAEETRMDMKCDHEERKPEDHRPPHEFNGPEDHRPPREFDGPEGHRPPREFDGPEDHRPPHEFDGPEGHRPPHEFDGPEGHRPPRGFDGPEDHRPPREFDGPEEHRPPREFDGLEGPEGHHPPFPPHEGHGPHRPPFPPHEGPGPHGPHHPPFPPHEGPGPHGPHHPPFPPHEGPGPHGPHPRPPRFNPEELLRQAEGASTLELFDLCHRVLHRPDAGAMRGQGRALAILAGRGEMSQRELQELLRVAPGSMSELLAKLERKGLLARERGGDRRSNLLKITDAGREAAAKVEAPGDELFSALSEEQRGQFAEMLKLLLADWLRRIERDPAERPE